MRFNVRECTGIHMVKTGSNFMDKMFGFELTVTMQE